MATINKLSALSSVSAGHLVPVFDASNGDARKMSITQLQAWLEDNLDVTPAAVGRTTYVVEDYGAVGDNATDDTEAIQDTINAARAVNGIVEFTAGKTYLISGSGLAVASSCRFRGNGSVLHRVDNDNPIISITNATSVLLDEITCTCDSTASQRGNIEIHGTSTDIEVRNCGATDGYAGVWVRGGTRIIIDRGNYVNCAHNIYIGTNKLAADRTSIDAAVKDVSVLHVRGANAKVGGDGLKTVALVDGVLISGCTFEYNAQDGIDLFSGGNNISIVNNIVRGNLVAGVDIKSNESDALGDIPFGNYTVADWGKQWKITIVGNIFDGNNAAGTSVQESAVKVVKTQLGDLPWEVNISNNVIENHKFYGVICWANGVNTTNNQFMNNGQNSGTGYHTIYYLGLTSEWLTGGSIIGNNIYGGGTSGNTIYGILLSSCRNVSIMGNTIDNVGPGTFEDARTRLYELSDNYEAHRILTTDAVHGAADSTNALSTAVATTVARAYARANDLKAMYEAHRVLIAGGEHGAADSTNAITAADATDTATFVALVADIATQYAAHRILTAGSVHGAADTTNIIQNTNWTQPGSPYLSYGLAFSNCENISLVGNHVGESMLIGKIFGARTQWAGYGNTHQEMNRFNIPAFLTADLPSSAGYEVAYDLTQNKVKGHNGSAWQDYTPTDRITLATTGIYDIDITELAFGMVMLIAGQGSTLTIGGLFIGSGDVNPIMLAGSPEITTTASVTAAGGMIGVYSDGDSWRIRNETGETLQIVISVAKMFSS